MEEFFKGLSYMGPNMGTPIYGPHMPSAKNVSSTVFIYGSYIWRSDSHICFFLYEKGRLPFASISYMGAVSFLNLHFEIFKIFVYLITMPPRKLAAKPPIAK